MSRKWWISEREKILGYFKPGKASKYTSCMTNDESAKVHMRAYYLKYYYETGKEGNV